MATQSEQLFVELGLKDSNFTSGIQNVNRQMKIVQQEFKNAGAGIKSFGTSIDGLKAKQAMLTQSIELQKQKVESYKKTFDESSRKLRENTKAQQELTQKVNAAKSAWEQSKKELGENAEETKQLGAEYKSLQKELNSTNSKIRSNATAVQNAEANMNKAEAELKQMKAELKSVGTEIDNQSNKWKKLYNNLGGFDAIKSKFATLGSTLTKNVTVPIAGAAAMAVKTNIDFENAFTGVEKTVNMSGAELEKFKDKIVDMTNEMPQTVEELSGVAEAAGQLGIENENLVDFTDTMVRLGDSTNVASEEAASALAKFANITGMSQTRFRDLGNVIVKLGNNFATTEADIINMSTRIAAAGKQAGMSEPEIMGFSAALSAVGLEAEAGGTAFSKLLNDMTLAVQTGSSELNQFASVAGMSASQFKQAFEQDAAGAVQKFIQGLADAEKNGKSAVQILDEMGIKEVRLRDALLRAAGASDTFTEAVRMGNKEWENGSALLDESNKKYETLGSQLKITKNKLRELANAFGERLAPLVKKANDKLGELIDTVSELDDTTIDNLIGLGAALAAVGPALKLISAGMGAIKVLRELKTLFEGGTLIAGLSSLTGLSGGAMLGVGAAGAVAGLGIGAILDKNKDKLTGFTDTVVSKNDPNSEENVKKREEMRAWLEEQKQMLSQAYSQFEKSCDDFIKNASDKLQQWIKSQGQKITEFFKNLPQTVENGLKTVSDNVQEFCLNIVSKISEGFGNIVAPVKDALSKIKTSVSNGFSNAKEAMSNKLNEMKSAAKQGFEGVVNAAKQIPGKLKTEAIRMGQNLIDGLKSKANGAKQAMTNIGNGIKSAATSFVGKLKTVGSQIIQGLIGGIKAKAQAAIDAAKGVVSSAINAAKNVLGINSPSRVFHEIGVYIDEGLANGVRASSDRPVRAVRDMAQRMQAEMDKFLKANQTLVGDVNTVIGNITTALGNKYQQMYDKEMDALNKQLSALESWKSASIAAAESRRQASIQAIDAEIAALERAYREKEQKEQEQDLDDQINEMRSAMEYEHNEENKKQIQKELDNLLKQKKKMQEKAELERQKEALQRQKEAIQAQKEAEIARIQASYDAQKKELEEKMKKLKEFWEKKLKEENLNAEAIKLIQDKNQKAIIKLLKDYLPEYKKAGYNMGEQLVLGMKPQIDQLKSMIAGILADINKAKREANALRVEQMQQQSKRSVVTNNNNARTANYTINVQGSNDNVRDIDTLMRSVRFSY